MIGGLETGSDARGWRPTERRRSPRVKTTRTGAHPSLRARISASSEDTPPQIGPAERPPLQAAQQLHSLNSSP